MPELPEVETMRRGILGICGGRIADVVRLACRRRPLAIEPRIDVFRRRARGCRVEAVDRLGKRVSLRLSSGDAMVFEPRMSGLVLVAEAPTQDHLRVRVSLEECPISDVWYWDRRGLGSVRLLTADQLAHELGPLYLGPDALVATSAILQTRLGRSRRPIKVALLDQRAVAGIGNIYAAEILHAARLHPQTPCAGLSGKEWDRLAAATRDVLERAIDCEGSTLGDGTYRSALNRAGGYQNEHRVYGKRGQRCQSCNRGQIRQIVQAQRSTFFCPMCQREARSGRSAAADRS
jgi:formamidopyrimidine-DNA glycosylase